jgi:integrase
MGCGWALLCGRPTARYDEPRSRNLYLLSTQVNKTQIHQLTADTYQAAAAYLTYDGPAKDGLLRGSRRGGKLTDKAMSMRAIQKRVKVLGERIGVSPLSPHDCLNDLGHPSLPKRDRHTGT